MKCGIPVLHVFCFGAHTEGAESFCALCVSPEGVMAEALTPLPRPHHQCSSESEKAFDGESDECLSDDNDEETDEGFQITSNVMDQLKEVNDDEEKTDWHSMTLDLLRKACDARDITYHHHNKSPSLIKKLEEHEKNRK